MFPLSKSFNALVDGGRLSYPCTHRSCPIMLTQTCMYFSCAGPTMHVQAFHLHVAHARNLASRFVVALTGTTWLRSLFCSARTFFSRSRIRPLSLFELLDRLQYSYHTRRLAFSNHSITQHCIDVPRDTISLPWLLPSSGLVRSAERCVQHGVWDLFDAWDRLIPCYQIHDGLKRGRVWRAVRVLWGKIRRGGGCRVF